MVLTLLFGVIFMIVGATSGRPSFIKISLHLARVVEAPTLPVCARLIFLIVGATTMFSKKTCGLPSNRPLDLSCCFASLSRLDAASLGVYIHSLAGDIAAERLGEYSLMASDIIDALPLVLRGVNVQ